jgi:hypothetical protein
VIGGGVDTTCRSVSRFFAGLFIYVSYAGALAFVSIRRPTIEVTCRYCGEADSGLRVLCAPWSIPRYGDCGTSFAQSVAHHALNVGEMAALGFELQRVTPAVENADDVGNAGDGADRLEDLRLDT